MRNLLFLSLLFNSLTALAGSYRVHSIKYEQDWNIENAKFAVNAQKGRAWIEFYEVDGSDWEDDWYHDGRAKVAGLYFNTSSKNIEFNENGRVVVCAHTQIRRRIFGSYRIIKNTGNCKFYTMVETINYDDGYNSERRRVTSLYLNIK